MVVPARGLGVGSDDHSVRGGPTSEWRRTTTAAMADVLFPNSCHRPPGLRPWSASDPGSFAYESTTARWPKILSGIINVLCEELAGDNVDEAKAAEAKHLMSLVSELKHQSTRDSPLVSAGAKML